MKRFAQLCKALDQTNKINSKIEALVDFFNHSEDADKVWAIALISQKRPKRICTTSDLRKWYEEVSDFPAWLFEGCYKLVGDLSETIALMSSNPSTVSERSLSEWIEIIVNLKNKEEVVKKEAIQEAWKSLDQNERLLFNKMISGGFRITIPQKIVISALARFSRIEENKITHRLKGDWDPYSISFDELVLNVNPTEDLSTPYPFPSAGILKAKVEDLGDPSDWMAQRKWDGVKGQLILRENEYYLWSGEGELVSDKFPELEILKDKIHMDVVIDGEILAFKDGKKLSYNDIKSRMGRKNLTKKHLTDTPIIIVASDLLEYSGEDIRDHPSIERRKKLEHVVNKISSDRLLLSDEVKFDSWDELANERKKSRAFFSEGLLLKKQTSTYNTNVENEDLWIWKVDPLTIDAVLIYVQRGSGSKSKTYTEFTFAVKHGEELMPFTKASVGLSEKEVEEISAFVKKNTRERFGPVKSIEPELVFEIEFEGIARSSRHKCGVALRFPRIKGWKRDKTKEEINSMQDLNEILVVCEGGDGASTLF